MFPAARTGIISESGKLRSDSAGLRAESGADFFESAGLRRTWQNSAGLQRTLPKVSGVFLSAGGLRVDSTNNSAGLRPDSEILKNSAAESTPAESRQSPKSSGVQAESG